MHEWNFDYDTMSDVALTEGVPLGSWPVQPSDDEAAATERTDGDAAPLTSDSRRPLPLVRILLMAALQAGSSFSSFMCLIVLVPTQLATIAGDAHKGSAVGLVLGISGVLSLLIAPLIGYLSDLVPWTPNLGRRAPLLLLGAVVTSLAVAAMLFAQTVAWYSLIYAVVTLGSLLQTVPYNGLIADTVPLASRGVASGVVGAAGHAGNLVGAAVSLRIGVDERGTLAVLIGGVVVATTCLTAAAVREPPPPPRSARRPAVGLRVLLWGFVEPLVRHHDFRWVFCTRLLIQQGVYTVQEFLLYYMQDMVVRPEGTSASQAVGLAMMLLTAGALPAALVGGVATDKLGRKRLVYVAGLVMMCCSTVAAFNTSYPRALVNTAIFGVGFGTFLAVDFAMVLDVLPSAATAAKDMAVWHAALVLPQLLATPVAGGLLDYFRKVGMASQPPQPNLGYQVVFLLAASYFAAGTVLVRKIRRIR